MIVKSEKTRKALLNQADCLEKIRAMIFEASYKPRGLTESELQKIEIEYHLLFIYFKINQNFNSYFIAKK